MRFTRIRARWFGSLRDLDTGPSPLPGLVAFVGPNEAGKSTVHRLVTALIHGFYPASRDQNPFAPWGGGDIDIRAEIELSDGESLEVRRRLLATPRGDLIRGDTIERLDNRTIPAAAHVSERVYSQVYAITLADLGRVEQQTWDSVRDHLVVGMASTDLRPPRAVARELGHEADRLWRPNRRGNPRHRALSMELMELRKSRSRAQATDRDLREAILESERLASNLTQLRERRALAARSIEELRALLPLRQGIRKLDDFFSLVGNPSGLRELPVDPQGRLTELRERLRSARDEQADVMPSTEERVRVALLDLVGPAVADGDPPDGLPPGLEEACDTLALTELAAVLEEVEGARQAIRDFAARRDERMRRPAPRAPPPPIAAGVTAFVGIVLLAIGVLEGSVALPLIAVVLVTSGLLLFRRWRSERSRTSSVMDQRAFEEEELDRLLEAAETRHRLARTEALTLLEPFSPPPSLFDRPGSMVFRDVERLVEMVRDHHATETRLARRREAASADLARLEDAIMRVAGGVTPDDVARAAVRRSALDQMEQLRSELVRESGDLDQLRERVIQAEEGAASRGLDLPGQLEHETDALEELDRTIEHGLAEVATLEERALHLSRGETVDLIDGRIEQIREELLDIERERDRLFLLSRIVERAEARFREANQPDLLRRAEAHLATITDGRYQRILTGRGEDPHEIHLQSPHLPHPVPVAPPLSTGTREQVYLAFRIAIVDHLDAGREPLPLLLDEVLVNWDEKRAGRALELLQSLSLERQVFLFTCHPHLAASVARLGGRVLELASPLPVEATPQVEAQPPGSAP